MAITIEPAIPSTGPIASLLLYMTMGRLSNYLFGSNTSQQTQHLLEQLFRMKRNRFSYQFTETGFVDGEVAGLILACPNQVMKSMEFSTAIQFIRVMGTMNLARFILRALPLIGVKECEKDEYFISNIAVLPKLQGKGIGKHLLSHTEKKARDIGFQRIALTVDMDNERAIAFYKQRRYKIVEYVEVNALKSRIGYPGFYRMAKDL